MMRGFWSVLLVIACAALVGQDAARVQPLQPSTRSEPAGADTPASAAALRPDSESKAGAPDAKPQASQAGSAAAAASENGSPESSAQAGAGNAPAATGTTESLCLIMESAALANGLPLEFFARVIWQESRFQPNAVGPMTRTGHRAQGIAQFMPYTAGERGLLDPFNPVAALPKAAEFLAELRRDFGNLGLAAAAYNAGPGRVRAFLGGRGGMPAETRNYVRTITGRSVDEWAALGREGGKDGIAKPTSCRQLAALLKEQPSFYIGELERHIREGVLRPWGVQLSAGFSRARVLGAYARIERQYRSLLENRDPMIIRTVLRSRGTEGFFQVRVGTDTREAANKLCADLIAKGAACMVLRNSRGSPELVQREEAGGTPKTPPAQNAPTAQNAPAAGTRPATTGARATR